MSGEHVRHAIGSVNLRLLEPKDLDALYQQKNDPEVCEMLGGFSFGYTHRGLEEWLKSHSGRTDEVIWAIADAKNDTCLGHVGLYHIDTRIRSAEFAIMIGAKTVWGRGLGQEITRYVLDYGFRWLNLRRIELSLLANNSRALALYEKLGFQHEGRKRGAQYKNGQYLDVILMALLRD